MCGSNCGFVGGGCGHFDVSWEPGEGVGNAFGSCFIGKNAIASVVVHGGAKVPPFDAVWSPSSAVVWLFMDEDLGTWGCQRSTVEIKRTED